MRHVLSSALLLLLLSGPVLASGEERVTSVLERLDSPSLRVRESAELELLATEELPVEALRRLLVDGTPREQLSVARVVAKRRLVACGDAVLELVTHDDPELWDAAARAVVLLGKDWVAKAETRLADAPEHVLVLRRLRALVAQHTVEQALFSRWQRKMGSYAGQFSDLAELGWQVQPVLLAMLFDVPLEDRFLELPEGLSLADEMDTKVGTALRIRFSNRRGYRTFAPLPPGVEQSDVFGLAVQALSDVADIDVLGKLLEDVAQRLQAHDDAIRVFRVRPFERFFAEQIEELLSARGQHRLLDERIRELARDERMARRWVRERGGVRDADASSYWARTLRDLASALHRRQKFVEAAETYQEAIDVSVELTGEVPAVDGYNRACALSRAGRVKEALVQLEQALATSTDDLPYEWVTEDGDLHNLHGEAEFDRILTRFYGTGLPDPE